MKTPNPLLECKNITKQFGGVQALRNLSFKIQKGSITGMIGPNGAGKTTAFNLISGYIKPDAGDVLYKENIITNTSPNARARMGITRTFQQIKLFKSLTVRENLLLAVSTNGDEWYSAFRKKDEKEANRQIEAIAMKMNIQELLKYPAKSLSYGQSKLIEIARCILLDGEILLLDEPAAGMNPTLLRHITKILIWLKTKGKTIFLIEHNMPFLMNMCDHIIVLNQGEKIVEGTPDAIQNDPNVLRAYLGGQMTHEKVL